MQFHGEALDPGASEGHAAALRQPGILLGDGHADRCRAATSVRRTCPDRPPTAIVNRTFVKRYLDGTRSDRRAVRRRLSQRRIRRTTVTVVGVVDDIRQKSVELEAEPAFYSSLTQVPIRRLTMVVATSLDDPAPLLTAIRDTVRKADPQIAVNFELVRDLVAATISRQQLGHDADADLRRRRRRCSPRSGSTASSPTACRSGATRWRRASRSAPRRAASSGW